MNWIKIGLFFLCTISLTLVNAQNFKIDSIENVLAKHSRVDIEKVDLLNSLGYELYASNAEKTRLYGKQSFEIATKLNYRKGEATSLWIIGLSYVHNNKKKSLEYFQKALDIAEQIDDKLGICNYLIAIWNATLDVGNINESDHYLSRALKIARSINNDDLVMKILYNQSRRQMTKGNYLDAAELLHQIIGIANEKGDQQMLSRSYNQLGIIHFRQGDEYKALEYFLSALKIDEQLNNKPSMFYKHMGIADIKSSQKEFESALESIQQAFRIAKEIKDTVQISLSLAGMGDIYMRMNNPIALDYLQEALKMQGDNSLNSKINVLMNIGIVYMNQGKYELAQNSLDQALELAQKKNLKFAYCQICMKMGDLFQMRKQYNRAIGLVQNGLDCAKEIGYMESQRDGYKQLSELNAVIGDYKTAYENHVLYKTANDSIFNDKKIRGMALLESSYEFEKKSQAYEMESANHRLEIKNQRQIILFLIIATLLILVLLFILYWSNKLKKRVLQLEIENVNRELEYSQKEMASATLKLVQNSESDAYCVKMLENIKNNTTDEVEKDASSLINYYKSKSVYSNWEEFETLFIKVNATFYDKLNERYPTLTPNERKLCVFLKLNMNNKDIAQITFQSEEALKKARLRLRKKMELDRDVNLATFIQGL